MDNQTETIYLSARYASEVLQNIPIGKWIDKSVGGCGLSHLALTDKTNAIILLPRVSLAENKVSQVDKYPNIFSVKSGVTATDVKVYIEECEESNLPFKILITYDSFALGKLDNIMETNPCNIYVDESQFLIEFSLQKPVLSIELHKRLSSKISSVSFFSAHPPNRDYLPEYIQSMPSIKYVWKYQTIATPYVVDTKVPYMVVNKILKSIIDVGSFKLNSEITFKKVVVFVNSVEGIKKIVTSINRPNDVAYLVGDTVRNDSKLNDFAYRLEDCTNLPKITIGTTTMISGIDLYDKETFNIVISSSTKRFTLFDKELDVPQAITRQRLDSNPFNNKFLFLIDVNNMDSAISKLEETYKQDLETLVKVVDSLQYLKDGNKEYQLAYKEYEGFYYEEGETIYVNHNLLKAKRYIFEQLYKQYIKGYNVMSTRTSIKKTISPLSFKSTTYHDYAMAVKGSSTTECFNILKGMDNKEWKQILQYGIEMDKVLTNYCDAKVLYGNRKGLDRIYELVKGSFRVGNFYPSSKIKTVLQSIYKDNGLNRKAKATDLYEFFNVTPKTQRVKGVTTKGFIVTDKLC